MALPHAIFGDSGHGRGGGLFSPQDFEPGDILFEEVAISTFIGDRFLRPFPGPHQVGTPLFVEFANSVALAAGRIFRLTLDGEFNHLQVAGLRYPQDLSGLFLRPVLPQPRFSPVEFGNAIFSMTPSDLPLQKKCLAMTLAYRYMNECSTIHIEGRPAVQFSVMAGTLNHACSPNAAATNNILLEPARHRDDVLTKATLRAVKPIRAGDEITISYASNISYTPANHLNYLQGLYGIQCRCDQCRQCVTDPTLRDLRVVVGSLCEEVVGNVVMPLPELLRKACVALDGFKIIGRLPCPVSEIIRTCLSRTLQASDYLRAFYFQTKAMDISAMVGGVDDNPEREQDLINLDAIMTEADVADDVRSLHSHSSYAPYNMDQESLDDMIFMMNHPWNDPTYYCLGVVGDRVVEIPDEINRKRLDDLMRKDTTEVMAAQDDQPEDIDELVKQWAEEDKANPTDPPPSPSKKSKKKKRKLKGKGNSKTKHEKPDNPSSSNDESQSHFSSPNSDMATHGRLPDEMPVTPNEQTLDAESAPECGVRMPDDPIGPRRLEKSASTVVDGPKIPNPLVTPADTKDGPREERPAIPRIVEPPQSRPTGTANPLQVATRPPDRPTHRPAVGTRRVMPALPLNFNPASSTKPGRTSSRHHCSTTQTDPVHVASDREVGMKADNTTRAPTCDQQAADAQGIPGATTLPVPANKSPDKSAKLWAKNYGTPYTSPFRARDGTSKQSWLADHVTRQLLRLEKRDIGHLLAAKDGAGTNQEGFVLSRRRDSVVGRIQGEREEVGLGRRALRRQRTHSFANDGGKRDTLKLADVRESKEL